MGIVGITHIFNLDRNTVRIEPAAGYTAAVMVGDAVNGAEVFIYADDGEESFRVRLAGTKLGQKIDVLAKGDGTFEVSYQEGEKGDGGS